MKKFTLLIASLFLTVGAMAQDAAKTIVGVNNVPTTKVDLSQGLESGYYLLKQTNSNSGAAGGQGVGYIKAANEATGSSVTSKNTGTPGADGATFVWYVEVIDAANNLITISTANKVAAWQAPQQHQKNLVAYASRATLKYHTGTVNISGDATPNEGSCFISNEGVTAFVHFSGDNLGSWTDTNSASMFMVEFYKLEETDLVTEVVYATEEVGNPTEDGVYRIYWKGEGRGYLAYHDEYPTKPVLADVDLSGHNGIDKHYKSTEDGVQREWYLITSGSGKKYLFSPYTGKFLTYSKEAANTGKGALYDANRPLEVAVEANSNASWSNYYILTATIDNVKLLLSSGCGTASRGNSAGYPVRWVNADGENSQMHDGGSPLTFVKVIGFPAVDEAIMAQAEAAISDYENPVEADVNFEWTTSTPWTAVEHYTSTVFNDNELDGVKYIEGEVTVGGARTATVTFTYIDGGHKLNIRGVEVIDAMGNIVAGDYHVGTAGGDHVDNTYTVSVAEAGTYKVRCYAAEGNGDQFDHSHGSIVVSFAKLNVMDLTKAVTFAAEYATLHLGYSVAVPAGVEAYVVGATNATWAEMVQVNNVIPAATPVILKKTGAATSYNFYYTSDEADEIETNLLKGSIADRYVADDAYVLGINNEEVGLYTATKNQLTNTAFKNNANKAYLPKTTGMNAVSYSFRFGEGTTGIDEITENGVQSTVIYDLTGRRVEEITEPGIYIVGGKKVLVK